MSDSTLSINNSDRALRLLIVDDEEAARYGMRRALKISGYEIFEAGSVAEARAQVDKHAPDVVLLDVNLPGESGLDYLQQLQAANKSAPLVIIITAHGSERTAVEVIKTGAYDYLSKPFEVDELRLVVKNAFEVVQLRRDNDRLREQVESEAGRSGELLGISDGMRRVRQMIDKVADTDATVMIRGESGTGKELVARAVHNRSRARRSGAFVALNCAALPSELIESELFGHEKGAFTGASARRQGKFEQADSGTLFLDEIGDMSLNVQAKLLRALEERSIERLGGAGSIPVDVRIISATHRPLEQDIADNKFRADLFYRLRVVTIDVPPLRERREDVPLLAEAFAVAASERYNLPRRQLAPAAMRMLMDYEWPGNVRELRNAIERMMVLAEADEISVDDLPIEITHKRAVRNAEAAPASVSPTAAATTSPQPTEAQEESGAGTADQTLIDQASANQTSADQTAALAVPFTADFREDRREFERRYIARCLEETNGNVTRAAAILGMHRQSLQHKLRELGLGRRYIALTTPEESDT